MSIIMSLSPSFNHSKRNITNFKKASLLSLFAKENLLIISYLVDNGLPFEKGTQDVRMDSQFDP